jgi:hypothetical protein
MTGSDLIVVAPWIIFAVCLTVLCIRLLRPRRSAPRSRPRGAGQTTNPPTGDA